MENSSFAGTGTGTRRRNNRPSPSSSPNRARPQDNAFGSSANSRLGATNYDKKPYWHSVMHSVIQLSKQAGAGGTFFTLVLAYALWSLVARFLFQSITGRRRMSDSIMSRLGCKARPKVFAYYFNDATSSQLSSKISPEVLSLDVHLYPNKRKVEWTETDEKGQRGLLNSQQYENDEHRALRPYQDSSECVPMHEWQVRSYPSCNNVHQIDLTDLEYRRNYEHRQVRILAHGYFRDVWAVREYDGTTLRILKTLRYRHDWDEWNFERHRVDANTFEVLTSSPRILDIYSFCGNSGAFEYAPGGAVSDIIYQDEVLPIEERFDMAVQISRAISNLHNFNHKAPAIVHADIYTNQFVKVDGRYKLNDFNRATFLYWNSTSNVGNCPYVYGDYNAWLYRSPEEYEYNLQTEKIDVYSMGNIFYSLMMNEDPFEKEYDKGSSRQVRKLVKRGDRPKLNKEIVKSSDSILKVLRKAMNMCHKHDWRERASSKEVADLLTKEWDKCVEQKRCKPGPDDEGYEMDVDASDA